MLVAPSNSVTAKARGKLSSWRCALGGAAVVLGLSSLSCRASVASGGEPQHSASAPASVLQPAASLPVLLGAAPTLTAPAPPVRPAPIHPTPTALAPRRQLTVAFMGDSLTDPRSGGGGYVKRLQQLCPESQFDNYGIGGQMTNQMRRRFQRDILGLGKPKYTHVVIFAGVNDLISNETAHRTNERIKVDLTQMYDWAREAGMAVVGLTVAPWGGFKRYFTPERGENTAELNRWILAGVGTRLSAAVETGPLLSCGNPDTLCATHVPPFNDGIHFGRAAHEALGNALHTAVFSNCK